jgi:hypothetical protein
MNTKNIITGIAMIGMLAGVTPALADSRLSIDTKGQTFCQRITTVESNWTEHFENKNSKGKAAVEKMKSMFGMRDKQRGEVMEMAQKNMDERNALLRSKATTDAEKSAVEVFITTMTTAEKTRTTAVDAAIASYRTGVETLLSGKTDAGSTAVAAFKTSVESALVTAKTACAGTTPDDKAIASAFKTSVKSAQETLKSKKTEMETVRAEIKKLGDVRKTAIDTAHSAFKTSVDTARTELQKVMKIDGAMKGMKKGQKKEMKEKREENKGERKEMRDGMKKGSKMEKPQ